MSKLNFYYEFLPGTALCYKVRKRAPKQEVDEIIRCLRAIARKS